MPELQAQQYWVERDREIGGAAPKDFIHIDPNNRRRPRADARRWPPNGARTWPAYIAKVGHKHYPSESITELLLTRLGHHFGLKIADASLLICDGQLRFLSRYFLREGEILNHGGDLIGDWLTDKEFIAHVRKARAEKELFTFQDFCRALEARFPSYHRELSRGLVRMIGFDALVGTNDRHFFNWGVITHASKEITPRFAPIFDTARGLFWNTDEDGLVKYETDEGLSAYVDRSEPQIGWDGWNPTKHGKLSHFDLVRCVSDHDPKYRRWLEELGRTARGALFGCEGIIDAEFGDLLSDARRGLIKRCLRLRVERFANLLNV